MLLAASEPSKLAFYLAAGALACWAVGLAIFGATHPDFPGTLARGRLVIVTSIAIVAATVATAIATASNPEEEQEEERASAPAPAGEAHAPPLALAADPSGQPAFDRTTLAARPGRVVVRLTNRSPAPHDVTIAQGSRVIAATRQVTGGEATLTTELAAGRYVFYCSVDGHRQLGMRGTLTVR